MVLISKCLLENPFVSIVIPSYNRADTVSETIDSIISQKCNFDFEIIIGDDCSTDNAREVLIGYQEKYPKQIKLLFYDQNIGLGANWATCVKECRGKYIANCDNDDYWHNPDKLQLQVDFMESHTEYGMCHTDYRKLNRTTGKLTLEKATNSIIANEILQKSIMNGNFRCCNATVLYRQEVLRSYVNLDDFIINRFTLQDWNTWMILANYTSFYCMPISTATFGIETESITRPKNYEQVEKRFEKEKECYQYICELFPNDFPYVEREYDNYVNGILLNMAYTKLDFTSAKKFALKINTIDKKINFAKNPFTFYLFALLKRIRK